MTFNFMLDFLGFLLNLRGDKLRGEICALHLDYFCVDFRGLKKL